MNMIVIITMHNISASLLNTCWFITTPALILGTTATMIYYTIVLEYSVYPFVAYISLNLLIMIYLSFSSELCFKQELVSVLENEKLQD